MGQNASSSFPFSTLHVPFHLLTDLYMEINCSYSKEFNLLTGYSIIATVISMN